MKPSSAVRRLVWILLALAALLAAGCSAERATTTANEPRESSPKGADEGGEAGETEPTPADSGTEREVERDPDPAAPVQVPGDEATDPDPPVSGDPNDPTVPEESGGESPAAIEPAEVEEGSRVNSKDGKKRGESGGKKDSGGESGDSEDPSLHIEPVIP